MSVSHGHTNTRALQVKHVAEVTCAAVVFTHKHCDAHNMYVHTYIRTYIQLFWSFTFPLCCDHRRVFLDKLSGGESLVPVLGKGRHELRLDW